MKNLLKRAIKYYELKVGTSKAAIKELRKYGVVFAKLNERGLLEGDMPWKDCRDEYLSIKPKYIFTSYAKIIRNLNIANQQLNNLLQCLELNDLDQNIGNFKKSDSTGYETSNIRDELSRLAEKLNRSENALKKQEEENERLAEVNAKLNSQYKHIRVVLKDNEAQMERTQKELIDIVKQMIMLRDQLEMLKTNQNAQTRAVMDNISGEIARALQKAGIEIVESIGGRFNEKIHTIVDTKKTDDKSKIDCVAENISAGYIYKGVCLKEQSVVIYGAEQEA